jgi:CBS domain-containing protein
MDMKEIMNPNVILIKADDTLHTAAARMKEYDIGFLPVVERGELVGTLTDRDIVVNGVVTKGDPETTPVRAAMSNGVVACSQDSGVEDALNVMAERKVRRLIVLNHENKLAGVASLGDLATTEGVEDGLVQALRLITDPT